MSATISTSNPEVSSQASTTQLDVTSPYFLHSSNYLEAILVSSLLNGDNCLKWQRTMKIALNPKSKLAFVDGSLTKPTAFRCHLIVGALQ